LQHGKGTEELEDGSKYEGEFRDGKKQGYGVYEWADGSEYKGNWLENNIDG